MSRPILQSGKPYPRSRPVNWAFVAQCLQARRESRKMTALGYRRHETDWEIIRGGRFNEVITDAQISADGKYVWTKIGPPHHSRSRV